MDELARLKQLSGLCEYRKVTKSKKQEGKKTSLFELPEFKHIDVMRKNGRLNAFSRKEIEEFFSAHDRSNQSSNS